MTKIDLLGYMFLLNLFPSLHFFRREDLMNGLQSCVTSIQSSLPPRQSGVDEEIKESAVAIELSDAQKFAVEELSSLLHEMTEWINETTTEEEDADAEEKEHPLEGDAEMEHSEDKDGKNPDKEKVTDEKDADDTEKDGDDAENVPPDKEQLESLEDKHAPREGIVSHMMGSEEWKSKVLEMNNKLQEWVKRIESIKERCGSSAVRSQFA